MEKESDVGGGVIKSLSVSESRLEDLKVLYDLLMKVQL